MRQYTLSKFAAPAPCLLVDEAKHTPSIPQPPPFLHVKLRMRLVVGADALHDHVHRRVVLDALVARLTDDDPCMAMT